MTNLEEAIARAKHRAHLLVQGGDLLLKDILLNEASWDIIREMALENGDQCWLGVTQHFPYLVEDGARYIWPWRSQDDRVAPFGADFVLPRMNLELEKILEGRDNARFMEEVIDLETEMEFLVLVPDLIQKAGGELLVWS